MTQSLTNPDSSDPTSSIAPLTGPSLLPHANLPDQSQSTNSEIQTAGHTQTTPVKSPRQRRVYRQNSGSQSKGRKHRSSAARSQKRKRGVIDDSDQSSKANSDPEISVMDLAQDSDNHNSKSKPTGKKTQGVAVTEFDDVALYFKAPTRAVGSTKGKKLWYKCRWCKKTYKLGKHTRSNLRVHRDGGVGRLACPGQNKAIETGGANLQRPGKTVIKVKATS
ncbi:hypothetical protein H4Q26_010389 [Puccinia striiformis f. sp. tritici PST-130]|nr:hypothetical protein H4Q26_010389 [Puccinia striiformis f. sp. tritici PST-130]